MLEKLFMQLFEKLKNEDANDKKSKSGCFDFFVNEILQNDGFKVEGYSITSKAIKNYYEKYVEKRENKSGEPKSEILNIIAKYLGYKNYIDFENANKDSLVEISKKNTTSKPKSKTLTRITIASSVLLLIPSFFFINNYNSETCIIWNKTQFERSTCNSVQALNNNVYHIDIANFKKINVSKKTRFFRNGKPIVWYGKSTDGLIEFFNSRGIHPQTLKELKPITKYIIKKYVTF